MLLSLIALLMFKSHPDHCLPLVLRARIPLLSCFLCIPTRQISVATSMLRQLNQLS